MKSQTSEAKAPKFAKVVAPKPKTVKVVAPKPKTVKVVAPKNKASLVPFRRMTNKELEEMHRKFYEEPTQDDFSRVFEEGLADGTLIVDEDEDDMELDYAEEPDSSRFNIFGEWFVIFM